MYERKKIMSFRIHPEMIVLLDEISEQTGLSRSSLIATAIEKMVSDRKKGRKAKGKKK